MSARSWLFAGASLALAGCTAIRDQSLQLQRDVAHEAQLTQAKLIDYTTLHEKNTTLKPIPPSYCYRVLQDIVCYSEPLPGAESRLVAAQGTQNSIAPSAGVGGNVHIWEEPSPASGHQETIARRESELKSIRPVYVPNPSNVNGTQD